MARRQWTLLIFSDDQSRIRQLRISRDLVRMGMAGTLLIFSLLTSFAIGFFIKEGQRLRAERLAEQNVLMVGELETIRGRLTKLQSALDGLAQKDEHFRLLAGLEPIDKEVHQVGIGGPGTATLQSSDLYRLDPEQGEMVFSTAYDLNAMLRRAQLLASSWMEATDSLSAEYDRLESYPSILPTHGYVSSSFTRRRWHPILNRPRPHEGIDVSAPRGTPILAAAKGRVSFVGRNGDYGLMVEIDHGHGYVTRYAHASRTLVYRGQLVKRGDKIGEVGATGLAVGPHLHYEVLVKGQPMNPGSFIFDGEAIRD